MENIAMKTEAFTSASNSAMNNQMQNIISEPQMLELSDIDNTISELALLVERLKTQSKKISPETL